ncbi:TPA: hypothetical protein N0F65_012725 [Lagenidium giganteum]|uniref:Uncharacterized protein n=1 Tax=Lagenidium giganteum TaxID=4803 RepID=A0AAV2YA80_9STRA|nr:TPA: hypothetical protein N0F65_012725 [Lagenidium giganteum]
MGIPEADNGAAQALLRTIADNCTKVTDQTAAELCARLLVKFETTMTTLPTDSETDTQLSVDALRDYERVLTTFNQVLQAHVDAQEDAKTLRALVDAVGVALEDGTEAEIRHHDRRRSSCAVPEMCVDPHEWNTKGLRLHWRHQYGDAVHHFTRAIELAPDNAEFWTNRAVSAFRLKNKDDALADADQALALNDGITRAWDVKGSTLMALSRHAEAVACYTRAIALCPDHAEFYEKRARVYHQANNISAALTDVRKAHELDPTFALAWKREGDILLDRGDVDAAITMYSKAISLEPRNAEFYTDRAMAYVHVRDAQSALDDAERAIDADSECAEAWNAQGCALRQMELYEDAVESYSQAIELAPKNTGYHTNRSSVYVYLEDGKNALQDADAAIRLHPDAGAYSRRGYALLLLERYDDAAVAFTTGLRMNQKHTNCKLGLASTYREKGILAYKQKQYETAVHSFSRALDLNPDNAHYFVLRSRAYYALDEAIRALRDAEWAFELDQKDPDVRACYGDACRLLGRIAEAKASYERGLELYPGHKWCQDGLEAATAAASAAAARAAARAAAVPVSSKIPNRKKGV